MVKINKNCRSSERGAALIIALVFMIALFLVVTSAMRFQRSTAENISQTSISSQERWAARALTARAAGWLVSKLPILYEKDLQVAIGACGNKNLPAFNPPENSSAQPCEFSYLGNLQNWLDGKKSGAVSFAVGNNQEARVVVNLTEAYRLSTDGSWQYKINYLIDSSNSENGTDTNQGEIFLGKLQNCSCELKLVSSAYAVPIGDSVTLTSEFWNIEKIELYENNVLIDSSPVQNLKTRQTKSWTRIINSESTFFVKGFVAANNCNAISNTAVVATTVVVPTPTPTPTPPETPTPTPTPTPPPFASRLCLAQSGSGWAGTACAEKNGSLMNVTANVGGPTNYFSPSCYIAVKDQNGNNLAYVSCNINGGSAANHVNITIPASSEVDHIEFGFSARNQGGGSVGAVSETLGIGACRVLSGVATCSRY